jgi:hypothetical protein
MVAEVFGLAIRKCPEIQVLRVPGGKEVKISQYADNNTCIFTNSYGLVKVIDVFKLMNMVEHPERDLIQRNQRVFGSVGGVLVLIHPVV